MRIEITKSRFIGPTEFPSSISQVVWPGCRNGGNHTIYTEKDFTAEEINRFNIIAVAVRGGAIICKKCGKTYEPPS